ncbi:MAG: ABC transporter ATP-binding protein [Acidobacteria bacterium]|nr:ABC transporter ATP-binding protein [Acidobacteriota bacterium]
MAVIEIENLTKDFYLGFWRKRPFRALDGISLSIEAGEVFGFLGPNGAGKTTTLKILMNLIRPTSGTARILGQPVDSVTMRRRIGYLPENPYFYDYLTPNELLTYVGNLFGMRHPELKSKVDSLLQTVGLESARHTALRKFSKGMVQRIGIAQALINDPEVVFLDEPMSGLDPLGRREVREVVHALKQAGVTVFFSSHILPDVEALCDRVAIMNKGRILEVGALHDILKMRIEGHEIILGRLQHISLEELKGMSQRLHKMGDRVRLHVDNSGQVGAIVSYALARGAELISVNPIRASLEDYFFREVEKP